MKLDGGAVMGLKDRINESIEKQKQRHEESVQDKTVEEQIVTDKENAAGILLVLSAIDTVVTFYKDHLEFRNRLGSKQVMIPYSQVRAAGIKKRSSLAKGVAAASTLGMSLAVPYKKILVVETGPENMEFEFRAESVKNIERAIDIILGRASPNIALEEVSPAASNVPGASKADELKKLAELHVAGVLTEEEFQIEKARILGG
jgi:hypothetical protein